MGRSRMNCMKITLHLLALCLLLSITTKVSGKPNPRHLLIETEEQAKKTADYKEPGTDYNKAENNYDYQSIQNIGGNTFTNSHFNNNQMNAAATKAPVVILTTIKRMLAETPTAQYRTLMTTLSPIPMLTTFKTIMAETL